jgi:hypothetical protein
MMSDELYDALNSFFIKNTEGVKIHHSSFITHHSKKEILTY